MTPELIITEEELMQNYYFSNRSHYRFARLLLAITEIGNPKEKGELHFNNEDYLTEKKFEHLFEKINDDLFSRQIEAHSEHYNEMARKTKLTLDESGFLRLRIDENHFPDVSYNEIDKMAKLCISYHLCILRLYSDKEQLILKPEIEEINLEQIQLYLQQFISDFIDYDQEYFEKPKLKAAIILKVARRIHQSHFLNVPELL